MRTLLMVIALAATTPVLAESKETCLQRWKAADLDANGSYEEAIDSKDYSAPLKGKGEVSRDAFLTFCAQGDFSALQKPDNAAASRDFGKGDLTPGPALKRADAEKKLKSLGYGDVKDLALDAKGIWRGTASVGGRAMTVAIDPQGDVVSD